MLKAFLEKGFFRVPVKLFILVVVLLIPLVLSLVQFVRASNTNIAFADKERLGVRYLEPLSRLYFRALGDLAGMDLESDLVAVERADSELAARLISPDPTTTTVQLAKIRSSWQSLRNSSSGLVTATALEGRERLIGDLGELIRIVGDRSNLILDPDLDSYYLMDAVIIQIPQTARGIDQLQGVAAPGRELGAAERSLLVERAGAIESGEVAIRRGMNVAFGTNAGLRPSLDAAVNGAIGSGERLIVEGRGLANNATAMPMTSFTEAGRNAERSYAELHTLALGKLDDLLEMRSGRLRADRNFQLGLALVLVLLALALAYWIARGITRQTASITNTFGQIGIGDFDARAQVVTADELGTMAQYLNSMLDSIRGLLQSQEQRDQIQTSIQKLLEEVSNVAEGDLTAEAEVTADVTGAIADSFNYMIAELRNVIYGVQETTLQVSAASSEVRATTEHLARGSETQFQQITDTTAAVDEMASSIQQVSENAVSAASVADQALANARQGAEKVNQTITGMSSIRGQVQETAKRIKRLGESSQEIGEIVELIGDIADRTSILALNASIQAAAAGDAGRGFAVVASEVDRLAERAAEATKNISTLIKSIQTETAEAVTAMEETTRQVVQGSGMALDAGRSLGEIEGVSKRLADLIQSISLAAKQQARGSESIAVAMSQISDVTSQTASGTKQAAVSIQNLAALAEDLRNSVSRFKLPERRRARR